VDVKNHKGIAILFYLSAGYDGLLGLAFLLVPLSIFSWFTVPPPNHVGYVQFPAALLLVFALMFLNIARAPVRNRNLIPYGILLKVSYCTVTFWHWFSEGIPGMWKPFAIADICFALLFLWAYSALAEKNDRHV
jgi:hypothetical protein